MEKAARRAAFSFLLHQSAGSGVFGVDLRQLLLPVDIGPVDLVHPSAAQIAAAAAAVARAAAYAEGAADDLLPLGAGGVLDKQGLHV